VINLSAWAIAHPALVRYLMVALLFLGVGSYFQLGQDEDPPFNFRVMVVQAQWPGATALQMADQVADRLERMIQDVPNIDMVTSFSKPGETTVIVQVKDDFDPAEVPDRFYQVRKKVTDQAASLPAGVQGPFFNDDFGDTFGVIYALQAPGYALADQADLARQARAALMRVPDVGKVEVFGLQQERVFIELSRAALTRHGLTAASVAQQVGEQNAVVSAGELEAGRWQIPVEVQAQFASLEDIRNMPLRAGGLLLKLGDVAQVQRGPQDPAGPGLRVNGVPAVGLGVSMQAGGDIVALGRSLAAAAAAIQADLPVGVELVQIQDQPTVVQDSVQEFLIVLGEAIAIVLAVSLLALGLHRRPLRVDPRPGLIVAISIPLVLAVTFLIMHLWGVGLHKISLGSLIIALGLLVDDAIIVVEMMVRKLEEGADRLQAATAAFELTAMPMLTGTLITAIGFLPIGIAKSVVGEYTFAIFAVTAAALMVSWLVSVFFVPALGFWLLRSPSATQAVGQGGHQDTAFARRFRTLVTRCVMRPVTTLALTVLVFVMGLVGMGQVEQQFFPDSSRPEILVDVTLAEGSSRRATDQVVEALEAAVLETPGVGTVASWVGAGAPRFFLPLDIIFPDPNVAQLVIQPAKGADRETILKALQVRLPDIAPEARLRIKRLPNGPPVPYPVAFRLVADRPEAALAAAEQVQAQMRAHPDLRIVHLNWQGERPVAQVQVDLARARELGVPPAVIARTLEARFAGVTVGEFRESDKRIPLLLRLPQSERGEGLAGLRGLLLPALSGEQVPLDKVARVEMVWEPGLVWRRDREYAVTVQAAIGTDRQAASVSAELMAQLAPLTRSLPAGTRLQEGGEVEESSKGQSSIFAGMPIMFFLTLTLLVVQLKSTPKSLMVLATAPLGVAGVAAALLLLDRPFGFVAMLGVIALMGMIMRNSVILIDQIDKERAKGLGLQAAIVEATMGRFRPIALTAAAAILAMIPLQGSVFWGPMAVAIMGGLIVATALTLLSLPALVALVGRWGRVLH
jgi:multidrug efflux pump